MMDTAPRLLPALVVVAVLALGSASRAAEPEAMATAPTASPGAAPSVADQIDTYLKTSPGATLPKDQALGVTGPDEPRKVHGMAEAAVGSNGYRSAFVQSDIPIGKTGTVSIAVGETRFNGRLNGYGSGYGSRFIAGERQSLALGFGLGDAAPAPQSLRCRQAGEDGPDLRLDSRFEGGHPRPCPPTETPTSPQ